MHVGLVTDVFPRDLDHPREGGVASALANLLDGLRARPEVERISIVQWTTDGTSGRTELPALHATLYREPGPRGAERWVRGGATRARIAARLREVGADIVHAQGAADQIDGRAFPSVLTVHGILEEDARYRGHLGSGARAAVIRHWQRRARVRYGCVVAIAAYVYNYLRGEGVSRFAFVPNAVHRSFFEGDPAPLAGTNLLFVGAVGRRKNPVALVRAAALLRRRGIAFHLRIAGVAGGSKGDRTQQAEIARLLREHDLADAVEMLGSVDRGRLRELMLASRCLVLPSLQETAPVAIAEAQALGLPVVASPVGGVGEMVAHGHDGFLVDPRASAALADAVARVLSEDSLAAAMGRRARERAQVYHPDRVAEQTVAVYRHVLGLEPGVATDDR